MPGHGELIHAQNSNPVAFAGATPFAGVLALVRAVGALIVLAALSIPLPGLAQSYESVFSDYQSHKVERAAIDWRDANRGAGELGGFVGQMRASPPLPRGRAPVDTSSVPRVTGMAEMLKSLADTAPRVAPESTR